MHIFDTYDDILTLRRPSGSFPALTQWKEYARRIHPELPEKLLTNSREYDMERDVLPVMAAALGNEEKLAEAHASFLAATEGLEDRIRAVTGAEVDADILLILGLCNGAGWATTLGGRPAVLLGVEKIIELNWCDRQSMAALLYHELGHLWHFSVCGPRPEPQDTRRQSLWQLHVEGVAMAFEQLLCGDPSHYHQNKGDWQEWCRANEARLCAEYLRRLDAAEPTRDFFGDWNQWEGRSDTGYYLGCELVKWLKRNRPLGTVARMGADEVEEGLRRYGRWLEQGADK